MPLLILLSDDEEIPAVTEPEMIHAEGLAALNAALCFLDQQPEATLSDTMLLRG